MIDKEKLEECWIDAITHAEDRMAGGLPVYKNFQEWYDDNVASDGDLADVSISLCKCDQPTINMEELIKKHLENWTGLKKSSIENYVETGKVSGSFFMALKEMMKEYLEEQVKNNAVKNIHILT